MSHSPHVTLSTMHSFTLSPVTVASRTLAALVSFVVVLAALACTPSSFAWGSSASAVGLGSRGSIPSASAKAGKAHTSAYSATASQAKGSAHASRKGVSKPAPTAKPIKQLKGSSKASSKPSLPSWQSSIGY